MGCEGFLKPINGKCLEVVAKEYFNDLVVRNLILVNRRGNSGETIKCKIHDLLVDVCIREAKKHKFLCVAGHRSFRNPQDLYIQRRIVVHDSTKPKVIRAWLSHHGTLVRSLTIKYSSNFPKSFNSSKLLRVLKVWDPSIDIPVLKSTHRIVNCRYISGVFTSPNPNLLYLMFRSTVLFKMFRFIFSPCIPSSNPSNLSPFCLLWNLQTLSVPDWEGVVATSGIWKISQLRHVQFKQLNLLDPPPSGHKATGRDDIILGNLQTLSLVQNLKFSDDVVKRIPKIKELSVVYRGIKDWSSSYPNNLVQLINLESLSFALIIIQPIPCELRESLSFPHSLKELTLWGTKLDWGELGTKIGSLLHLQVLILQWCSVVGAEWETNEGQFRSLKYLKIHCLYDLMYWRTESCTHFPCLEYLSLYGLLELKEIPSEIGETLKSIEIVCCRKSAIFSANEILKEQEGLGNEGLQVQVTIGKGKNTDVESLVAPNFQVIIR